MRKLMELQAKTARVVRGGEQIDIPMEEVVVGDIVVVRLERRFPSMASSSKAVPR